ncbi:MAG: hypothetical protein H6865_01920 [Rhodospirillales bacterium]|nr:hypothetical protein [Alphaproteobacteria bacterium]MCB9986376.1 hypothetical protein [Rhodospirillales bacterium]USO07075.1 MAG: hypothetical protein H6866_06465 [Rhodospirillales bacterium]
MNTKPYALLFAACLLGAPAMAQEVAVDPVMQDVSGLQNEWAHIKYEVADKKLQKSDMAALGDRAAQIAARWPNRAEPKIWEGIILATDAGMEGGISALGKVKDAKTLFEQALQIDDRALDGSAHTSLGSLYYQVPGWPVAFGDDKKAETELRAALAINPDGIDQNYFYGDYLVKQKKYKEAVAPLQKALSAPPREGRAVADAGRRKEIEADLGIVAKNGVTSGFN